MDVYLTSEMVRASSEYINAQYVSFCLLKIHCVHLSFYILRTVHTLYASYYAHPPYKIIIYSNFYFKLSFIIIVALMAQQSSKMSSVSTTSVTTSTDSKPTTSVSPAPTDPPSTSKHGDSDKRHDHPTTFTDDDDNLKKPSASKMATFQSEATDNDDFKKPSASKMASSQSKSNTFTDDDDLKKPSRMASSQSESGGTQLDKPPVTSQASGGSEISQKSSVVGNKVVTQSSTTHQTVTDLESSAAESYMPLGTYTHK